MMYCLRSKLWACAVCLLFLAFGPGLLQAQHKKVQIDFNIREPDYVEFYRNSLADLHKKGGEMIAQKFQEQFPFIRFATLPADYRLLVTIDRQQTGLDNPLHQVDISLTMSSPSGPASNTISTVFRSADQFFQPLPNSNNAFLQELEFVIWDWLKKEPETVIRELISPISLAEKAHPDHTNQCWVLPFSEDSLLIGMDSEFIVRSKLETSDLVENIDYSGVVKGNTKPTSTSYPPGYRGAIFVKLKTEALSNLDKMTNSGLQVKGVHITKYIPSRLTQLIPPEDFNFASN